MNYLSAMAAPGSRRHHLDGSDAGGVTGEHRAIATARLAEKMAVMIGGPTPAATTPAAGQGATPAR